jgi:hypothetical protein
MSTANPKKKEIKDLKAQYDRFAMGKESLLNTVDQFELPEKP